MAKRFIRNPRMRRRYLKLKRRLPNSVAKRQAKLKHDVIVYKPVSNMPFPKEYHTTFKAYWAGRFKTTNFNNDGLLIASPVTGKPVVWMRTDDMTNPFKSMNNLAGGGIFDTQPTIQYGSNNLENYVGYRTLCPANNNGPYHNFIIHSYTFRIRCIPLDSSSDVRVTVYPTDQDVTLYPTALGQNTAMTQRFAKSKEFNYLETASGGSDKWLQNTINFADLYGVDRKVYMNDVTAWGGTATTSPPNPAYNVLNIQTTTCAQPPNDLCVEMEVIAHVKLLGNANLLFF